MTQEEIDALPDVMVLKIAKPFEFANIAYSELTFREPIAGQIKQVAVMDEVQGKLMLMSFSAGVPLGVIDKLTSRELRRVNAFLDSFISDAEPAGAVA